MNIKINQDIPDFNNDLKYTAITKIMELYNAIKTDDYSFLCARFNKMPFTVISQNTYMTIIYLNRNSQMRIIYQCDGDTLYVNAIFVNDCDDKNYVRDMINKFKNKTISDFKYYELVQ